MLVFDGAVEKITSPQFDTPAPPEKESAQVALPLVYAVQLVCPECKFTLANEDAQFCPLDGTKLERLVVRTKAVDPLIGHVLSGRYKVVEPLGEGGMGTVYRVQHEALGKQFAVKVLRPELARDAELSQRFIREARAMARVISPQVIQVTDFGELEDRRPFFVMELLSGNSLSSMLKAGKLPSATAIAVARGVCDALAAAHSAGIVHRDLKPDNIYVLQREGEPTQVKVLDFGLAHVVGQSRLTRQGVTFGTPHYMSPEQAAGGEVDHRADIYALGIVLYEMLTGRVPFEADSYMGVLTKQLYAEPAHLSEQLELQGSALGLDAVVHRCLQKRPEDRYATMKDLALALDELSSGARSVVSVSQASNARKRSKYLAAFAALGMGVVGTALWVQWGPTSGPAVPVIEIRHRDYPSAPPAQPSTAASHSIHVFPAPPGTLPTASALPPSTAPNSTTLSKRAAPKTANPKPTAPKADSAPHKPSPLSNPDLIDPWPH